MRDYKITGDAAEIISGTSNKTHPAYIEASEITSSPSKHGKSMSFIKKFMTTIETVNAKVRNKNISTSRGSVTNFKDYDTIVEAIDIVKSYVPGEASKLAGILEKLKEFQPIYSKGYERENRLLILEYENALYILIIGLSYTIANNISLESKNEDVQIVKCNHNSRSSVIGKLIVDVYKELSKKGHKDYLESLSSANPEVAKGISESVVMTEGVIFDLVSDTLSLIGSIFNSGVRIYKLTMHGIGVIKNTLFGILPLIRACIYLRYKRKADAIIGLEEQVTFLKRNIENLKKRTNMDAAKKAEIIKKQEAYIAMYTKKAEKLRAELGDAERDTAKAVEEDDKNVQNTTPKSDDEFVLESSGIRL